MRGWGRPRAAPAAGVFSAETYPVRARPPQMLGVTDRALAAHYALHERHVGELVALRTRLRGAAEIPPALTLAQRELMRIRVCDMTPRIEGRMAALLGRLRDDFVEKGITWFPTFFPGDDDFWTADRCTGINVPWYLMNDALWDLVNARTVRWSEDDLMRVLRHEAGHALGYAYELWKRPEWASAFGDFDAPYRDEFEPDPLSEDFVRNLHLSVAAACPHYAQKHPDEDWAETFACWLDPGRRWREDYAAWPGALSKLETVESLVAGQGLVYGDPVVRAVGKGIPWAALTTTPAEYLGEPPAGEVDERGPLLVREAHLASECALHELFFEQAPVARFAYLAPFGRFASAVVSSFGGIDVWLADLRAAAAGSGAWVLSTWDAGVRRVRTSVVSEYAGAGAPPGAPVLLALDMREHAYALDYGTRKDRHVAALLADGAIDWEVVERRLDRADPRPVIFREVFEDLVDVP